MWHHPGWPEDQAMTAIRTMTRLVPAVLALVSILALLAAISAPMLRAATPTASALPIPGVNPWAVQDVVADADAAPSLTDAAAAAPARTQPRRPADEAPELAVPPLVVDGPDQPAEPAEPAQPAAQPDGAKQPGSGSASGSAASGSASTSAGSGGSVAPLRGPSLVIPELGIRNTVTAMPCDHVRPVLNETYHWECAGANNRYLLGHAYSVFKGLHDGYEAGRLHVGMRATWTDATGRVTTYAVTEWRVVTQDQVAWAVAAQPVDSMTLQTCLGANSEFRLLVRLVAVS